MKITQENILKIKLKGSDITDLKSGIIKITEHATKVGFSGLKMTKNETEVIKKFKDSLK